MPMLGILYTVCAVFAVGFIIFLKTPAGKKWKKNL